MSGVFRKYSFEKWIYQSTSLSTNADITKSVSKNTPNANIVLYTYKQSEGKGQIGRKWHSDTNKNLTFSLLININQLLAKDQFHFNMIVSLALRDCLAEIVAQFDPQKDICKIKWPNDIYIKNKKLAGVLIQNTLADKYISKSVVGVGVNANTMDFPVDLPNPISLAQVAGKEFDLKALFANVITAIEKKCFQYDRLSFSELKKQYIEKMYLLNERRTFTLSEKEIELEAEIIGITNQGKLQLKNKAGVSEFNFREIRYKLS